MADDHHPVHPPYFLVPSFLLREGVPGVTASIIATYAAICSFIYRRSRCSEKYSRWAPGIQAIGKRAMQHPSTVKRNLAWLEREGFIYRTRRFNQASVITLVDDPERFRAMLAKKGKAEAVKEAQANLERSTEEARKQRAKASRPEGEKDAPRSHKNKRQSFPQGVGSERESRLMSSPRSPNEPTPVAVRSHENYPSGGSNENRVNPGAPPALGASPPPEKTPEEKIREQQETYQNNTKALQLMLTQGATALTMKRRRG